MSNLPPKPKSGKARRRYNLWIQDPHCYYCREELNWKDTTIEHLYSKVKTGFRKCKTNETTVLSCEKCNQEQARKEFKSLPRHIIWMRCGGFPKVIRKDLTIFERWLIFKVVHLGIMLKVDFKISEVRSRGIFKLSKNEINGLSHVRSLKLLARI